MKLPHQLRFLFALASLSVPFVVHAVPADSRSFPYRQPDGTEIFLRVRGDEWFHWYETPEGRPVAVDAASGFWVYSVPDETGKQPPGLLRVGWDQPTIGPWRPRPSVAQRHNLDKQQTAAAKSSALSVGRGFIPVLLGNFSDKANIIPANTISNILFATGTNGVRSMSTYYSEVSYGRFTVAPGPSGVHDWFTVPHPAAYYATNVNDFPPTQNLGPAPARFVRDVVLAAIAAGYNFGPYDQDGDGKVDVVNVVHAGRGQESGGGLNTIWSHRYSLSAALGSNGPVTVQTAEGPKVIDDYVIQPELGGVTNASTIGVFVHEHGHALGLPDLYDNDYSSEGVGDWSGMSFGENNGLVRGGDCPALFDAWCKAKLNWVIPITYTLNYQNVQFPAAATNPFVAKLWKDGVIAKQYYLVENRYRTGFDSALPASGLLIWHIDETTSSNRNEWYPISPAGTPPNTNNGNFLVALMQADNLWQLGLTNANTNLPVQFRQNQGDAGDPFPGSANNRVFGPTSSPNSYAYNVGPTPGYNSFVTVSNISDAGPVMTADLYTRSPNSGPLVDWVNIAGVAPPYSGAQFSKLDAQHPVVIRAFPGVSGVALSQVQLYLNRASDGRWWNFASQLWETNIPSNNYNVTAAQHNGLTLAFEAGLPSGTNLLNGGYNFIVRVINASTIVTEIQMAMTAARAPEMTLSLVDNSVVNTLTNFTAVATEDSGVGVQRVEIALYYETEASEGGAPTRWYWSGYVWTTTPLWLGADFSTHPSQATLYYPIGPDANALQVEKEYVIAARAVDGLGDAVTNTIAVFYDPGSPATIYWRYAASGNWFDPANWIPSRVPLATDHAVVNAPGDYTVMVSGAATVASLRFGRVVGLDRQHLEIPTGSFTIGGSDTNKFYANATLDLGANLSAGLVQFSSGATWNWTGGLINGTYGITAGASFNLGGSAIKTLPSGALIRTAGSGTWSGTGKLNAASGGVISNSGTFTVLDDAPVFNYSGGSPLFINTGTFVKAGGTNTSFLPDNGGMAFNNSGIISVLSGVLRLGGGGTGSNGTFNAAAGAGIDWTAGNVFMNGNTSFSGGGTNRVTGAAMTFGGGISTMSGGNHFEVAAGSVAGTNSFAGTGFFNWSGGSLSANLNLGAGVSFNLSGGAIKTLASGALICSTGSGTWSGTGKLNAASGGVISNSGTFTVLDDAPVFNYSGGSPLFINTGTFVKASGTNTSFLPDNGGMAFNNSGIISVLSGVLSLGGGGTGSNGTFNAAAGAGIDWTAGNVFVNGNTSFSGGGTNRVIGAAMTFGGGTSTMSDGNHFEVAAGSVAGTNSFAGAGLFKWSGGSLSANLNLGAGVSFNLSGAAIKTLANGALISSAGLGTWSGTGKLNAANGGVLNNSGTLTVLDDAPVFNFTGGSPLFINTGTFVKAGGTNTSFLPDNGGMAFNNSGIISVLSGVLRLGGGGTGSNGTFNAAAGSGIDWTAGNVFMNGNTSFSGGGTNRVTGAAMTFGGGISTMSGGNHFEVAAGSVAGTNSFAGTGDFNWSGGSLSANLNLGAGVSFNLSGGAIKTLASGALISSAGLGTWSGTGKLNAANGGVLNNSGTLTVLDDAPVFNFTGGSPLFINTGTFVKAGGTNTSFLPDNGGMAFNNSGIVSVLSGVLSLGGGGRGSNGTFNAAAGAGIDWTAGNVFVNGNTSFSGGGTNRVIGAAMTFGGGTSTMSDGNHFEVAAGSVAGTNSFAGAGFFNWSGGSLSANLNLGAGVSFNLSGAAIKTLANGALISSAGLGTWSGTGKLNAANGGVLNNSGTLTVLDDAPVFNFTGGSPLFINTGTFVKAGGTYTSFLPDNGGMAFNNSGIISVLSGVLSLGGGGTGSNGTFNAAAGAGIDWTAGNVFVNGNSSFSGGGTNRVIGAAITFGGGTGTMSGGNHFEVAAGSVAGTNNFAGTGDFNWSGGSLAAKLNLGTGVTFNLSGGAIKTLASGALVSSAGAGTWSGTGRLNVGSGSALSNGGTFTVLSDAQVLNDTGGSSVFINNGTFLKTGGTNTSFLPDNGGMAFNNNGSVDLRSGVLTLGAGYTPSPTSQVKLVLGGLAAGAQFSQLNLGGAAALAGTLSVTLANGFSPTNGSSFAIVNYGSLTSQFSAQQLPTLPLGRTWKMDYAVNALTLRVQQGQALLSPAIAAGGAFGFDVTGLAASSATVLASTNLVNWIPIFTNTPFAGSFHFSDPQGLQLPERFYRVLFQ